MASQPHETSKFNPITVWFRLENSGVKSNLISVNVRLLVTCHNRALTRPNRARR